MMRVLGLAILLGCATAMLVWFSWGLVANVIAIRRAGRQPEPGSPPEATEPAPD